jgi:hypothetical protein
VRKIGGHLVFAIGVIHTVAGIFIFREPLAEMVRVGWAHGVIQDPAPLSTIHEKGFHEALRPHQSRMAAFWFLWSGFAWLLLGAFCAWFERRYERPVPAFVGWGLLVYALVGVATLPISGFYLLVAASIYMIVAARKAGALPHAPVR